MLLFLPDRQQEALMTPKQLGDQAVRLLLDLIQFFYDWTVGLILEAMSLNPTHLSPLKVVLWIVVALWGIGFLAWLLTILGSFFGRFFGSYWGRYGHYFFPYTLIAWICALLLVKIW